MQTTPDNRYLAFDEKDGRQYEIVADFEYEHVRTNDDRLKKQPGRDVLTSIHLKTIEGYKVQHAAGETFVVFDPNVSYSIFVRSPALFNALFLAEQP